jgi:hypothetical protein
MNCWERLKNCEEYKEEMRPEDASVRGYAHRRGLNMQAKRNLGS